MTFLSKINAGWYYKSTPLENPSLHLRYLGTAGFVLKASERTIVIDPFITRPSLMRTALRRLRPNVKLLKQVIPQADDVLIGHSHHDHILDAPAICGYTGARLIGSHATCNVGRAAGLPESQLLALKGRSEFSSGRISVKALPSLHGRVYFNRVSLPGDIVSPPPWPPRFYQLRHGDVFNWWLDTGNHRIMHIDSADYINSEIIGLGADIVCLCAIGRRWRPNYVRDIVDILKPRIIIPCHWDWFFDPFRATPRLLPGVDLKGFIEEIEGAGVKSALLPINGDFFD